MPSFQHDESGRDQKSFLSYGVPTPLLLANGIASLPPRDSTKPKAEPSAPHQATEPLTSEVARDSKAPELTTNTQDLSSQPEALKTSSNPHPVSERVPDSKTLSSAAQTAMLDSTSGVTGGDKKPKSLLPALTDPQVASEIDVVLIPPPSDFSDEPRPEPEEENDLPTSAGPTARGPLTYSDLENLRKKASMEKTTQSSPATQDPPSKTSVEEPISTNAQASLFSPLPEADEPRSPPAVAPKPKKLPSNIILKSHRASVAGSDGNSGHSASSSSDRVLLDPQKVRMEALRKLGLLKSDEVDSGPALSPKLSPKSRKSWAAPSPPISPAAHTTPTQPSIPSPPPVISPAPVPVSVPASTPATIPPPATTMASATSQDPAILPVPAAFSDPFDPLPSHAELSSVKELSEPSVNLKAQSDTPPGTPAVLLKHSTPPKVKSATLERSGMGLSSYMASQESTEASQGASAEHSPGQLRNARPRPASLGNGKDFASVQGEGLSTIKDPDTRMSLPAASSPQPTGDSQKLPRSHGISVLICPRSKNGEDRREALKKLGLLRD